ncbi:MAG: cytidylate kinase-like family protein [Lachnospiraceae bacterium]|uniref:cytidylate kinase-like family protein n=1 Tax=Roseburia hominis TaxID=301301 RepID=UPI001F2850FB|nr:cytidylate kinase-like family protein [Roseburia hominis]MCI5711657.1 cytidylate kinase-like family protein [Lachnospiraceae bacterium]MDD6170352.1 cytidylate kinase-like family protein [Lachnospiraceae bacterium]MDY4840515.1 cytidylate kinase-like family protein [Lachnospiraceae bacterium]
MKNYVITVARGFGSGGKQIASRVAEELGIHCYENRILTLASQMSGLDEQLFREVNEKMRDKKVSSFLRGLPITSKPKPEDRDFVSDEKLYELQKQIIEQLADSESCVIVGKCADWVLKDRNNVVSVYIEAPRHYCVQEIMERMGVNEATANKSIEQTDKYRAAYYEHYTGGNYWTNPVNYDLTLNSERVGKDNCVNMILDYLKMRFPDIDFSKKNGAEKEENNKKA